MEPAEPDCIPLLAKKRSPPGERNARPSAREWLRRARWVPLHAWAAARFGPASPVSLRVQVSRGQVDVLLGDPTKALTVLGWNPTKTPFVKVRRIRLGPTELTRVDGPSDPP